MRIIQQKPQVNWSTITWFNFPVKFFNIFLDKRTVQGYFFFANQTAKEKNYKCRPPCLGVHRRWKIKKKTNFYIFYFKFSFLRGKNLFYGRKIAFVNNMRVPRKGCEDLLWPKGDRFSRSHNETQPSRHFHCTTRFAILMSRIFGCLVCLCVAPFLRKIAQFFPITKYDGKNYKFLWNFRL